MNNCFDNHRFPPQRLQASKSLPDIGKGPYGHGIAPGRLRERPHYDHTGITPEASGGVRYSLRTRPQGADKATVANHEDHFQGIH